MELDDVCDDILDRRGVTPKKLGSEFTSSGHRVISAKLMKNHRVDLCADEARFVDAETYERWMPSALQADDVLLTSEAPLGEVAYLDEDVNWTLGQRLFAIRTKKESLHGRYLFYALRGGQTRHDLLSRATGSTATGIRQSQLRKVKVTLPPLPEQRAIAAVLGSLDDKIALNRRMNRTLESLARAWFQSWFVDFDPVHLRAGRPAGGANAAGSPTLPPDLAALIPATFTPSPLGDIPEGWEVRSLDEIADYLNGLALQKYPAVPDEPSLPRLKIAQLRKGDTEGADLSNTDVPPKYVVDDGDVIFSWSGSLLVRIWTGGKAALNQHLFKVTSDEFPRWFYFLWTQHHLDDFQATAASKATTMGHIKRHHLSDAKVVVPPTNVLQAAGDLIAPLHEQMVTNDLQSRTLAALRDALLPQLLSGDLAVCEVRSAVEAA